MPRDISSSSSEDEADESSSPPPDNPRGAGPTEQQSSRYQCPADFVCFRHQPCRSTLTPSLRKGSRELWLIKAPASFSPERFGSVQVPLSGLQTVQVPAVAGGAQRGHGQHIYSILASTQGASELRLLTGHGPSSDAVFGPAFSGLLNVCESYGDSSTNQAPQVIPATPAPSIPPGLKQRFYPFGSKTSTLSCVADSEPDGAAFGSSSTTPRPRVLKRFQEEEKEEEEEEEERKKKKKKKKEKRIKTEQEEEEVRVKEESEAEIPTQDEMPMELPSQDSDVSAEKRKKKKKKRDKDRERVEVDEGVEAAHVIKEEEVSVKCEPLDTSYGDSETSEKKKKKKKKKSKTDDD